MGLINSPDNGATEVPGSSNNSLFVFLAGPIRHWWAKGQWESRLHKQYTVRRDIIHEELSNDFLVYAPHRAWRGPWNEIAQKINDQAILLCDAMVGLKVDGIVARGTESELAFARSLGKSTYNIDIQGNLDAQLVDVKYQLITLAERLGKNA